MIGDPKVSLTATARGLNFGCPDGRDFPGFAGQILRGTGFSLDMNPPLEGVFGGQEGLDEGGFERVRQGNPQGFFFRGRNCRKS